MRFAFCRGTLLALLTISRLDSLLRYFADNPRDRTSTWFREQAGRTEIHFSSGKTNLRLRYPRGTRCIWLQGRMTIGE